MAKNNIVKTSAVVLAELQTAMDCLELRKRGVSVSKISTQLGVPVAVVRRYIEEAVTNLECIKAEDAVYAREIELARLDELYGPMYDKALRGDTRALQACLSIMERRARLAGLDKPSVVEKHITLSEVIPLDNLTEAARQYVARLEAIDAEVVEVPNE